MKRKPAAPKHLGRFGFGTGWGIGAGEWSVTPGSTDYRGEIVIGATGATTQETAIIVHRFSGKAWKVAPVPMVVCDAMEFDITTTNRVAMWSARAAPVSGGLYTIRYIYVDPGDVREWMTRPR